VLKRRIQHDVKETYFLRIAGEEGAIDDERYKAMTVLIRRRLSRLPRLRMAAFSRRLVTFGMACALA